MSGTDVVGVHSKSLQGQPAEQFSSIWYWVSFNINSYLLHRGNWAVVSWNCSNNQLHILDFRCIHERIFRALYCFHLYTDSSLDFHRPPLFNVIFSTIVSIKRFFMRNRTHLTTADWIVAIFAAIKTIELARTILIYLLSHQTKLKMHRPKKNGVIYHYNIDHFLASTGSNKRHRQHHSLQCTPTKLLRIFSCTLHLNPGLFNRFYFCNENT